MIIQTIFNYLETNKRLVVPQLGAFIVKVPGCSIVFSELLKRDDGVLRELLVGRGLSEIEAAGVIDRFVFEIRHAIQQNGQYRVKGYGVLSKTQNGSLQFMYNPESQLEPERPAVVDVASSNEQQPVAIDPKVSKSAALNPEPYVKGLRYGKPVKTTNSYTYVGRDGKRKIDKFLIIGIVAVVIAIAAIAYGYVRSTESDGVIIDSPVKPDIEQVDSINTTTTK